ncbi:hypothetical protein M408DRAFT_329492 [Serendipita vermifera MAFF 305830]|uniref:Uncharacterized protein n=1 Tax=Serendipita vermifera MAFF 305830 TaxID=933852 RepID=A0A0C2WQF5_SERVB|nr:hypothetical protein M408DRAFT_329492 [Serendipita vermifera MAFF 305830]
MRLHCVGPILLSVVSGSYAIAQTHFEHPYATSADSEAHIRNATDNLIFTSVASLLQQWPNTRFRNGHTIVKAAVPVGTVLYHARGDQHVPLIPEWTGFNVEHSYLLCPTPECWMLTLVVEKPLNVIYFDGSSAANSYLGHQDSQDVVIWGRVRRDKMMAEWERIEEICKWGRQYNLDGFIRMEPGFEVMLCDFTKKTKLISSIHIMGAESRHPATKEDVASAFYQRQSMRMSRSLGAQPSEPPKPPPRRRLPQPLPPNWVGPLRDHQSVSIEGIQAAWWNSFYPGEVRARIDYTRLVSFYDPGYTSLLTAREGIPRNRHRLLNISTDDLQLAMSHLHSDLTREDDNTSGIDWSALTRAVTDRYTDRLYSMKATLAVSNVEKSNATLVATTIRRQVMVMLTPYLLYGALPSLFDGQDGRNASWVQPIAFHCQTSLTSGIVNETLTRSERLIKSAIEGVLHRICTSLTEIWVDAFTVTAASDKRAAELINLWRDKLEELMRWLDWPMWDTCRPSCPEEMFCYISTWPWGMSWTEEDVDTIDMTPRCIDRTTGDLGEPHSHPHVY